MTLNASRQRWAPDRPKSVDPSLIANTNTTSLTRPPLPTSISSSTFSSQFSHSTSTSHFSASTPATSSSTQKWIPRSMTPGPLSSHSQHTHTRSRSGTGSSIDGPPISSMPPPPVPTNKHRKTSSASTGSSGSDDKKVLDDNWKAAIHQETMARFRARAKEMDAELHAKLRGAQNSSRNGFRGNDFQHLGSIPRSHSPQILSDDQIRRCREEHERAMQSLEKKMREEEIVQVKHEEKRRKRRLSRSQGQGRGVLVEDADEQEAWLWRPDDVENARGGGGLKGQEKRGGGNNWDYVRKEQHAIWDAIKSGGGSPPNTRSSHNQNNSSHYQVPSNYNHHSNLQNTNRKVRWAPSPLPSTPGMSLQRSGSPAFSRPMSAAPSAGFGGRPASPAFAPSHLRSSSVRPVSPVVPLMRPPSVSTHARPPSASAHRPTSPGMGAPALSMSNLSSMMRDAARESREPMMHERWLPGVQEYAADIREKAHPAGRPIPGRNTNYTANGLGSSVTEHTTGDSGSVGSGSGGSWRDWKIHGHHSRTLDEAKNTAASVLPIAQRRSVTPAPAMTSSASKYASGVLPPLPNSGANGHKRTRTLSTSAAPVPPMRPATPPVKTSSSGRLNGNGKGKAITIVDDREEPEHKLPVPDEDIAAPIEEAILPAPRWKGKGKAKGPAGPIRMSIGMQVYGLFEAQLEDTAMRLRRELSISTEA